MDSVMLRLHHKLDALTKYLSPLLPLLNCHMVEFITEDHWNKLLPTALKEKLDKMNLSNALDVFWNGAEKWQNNDLKIKWYGWNHDKWNLKSKQLAADIQIYTSIDHTPWSLMTHQGNSWWVSEDKCSIRFIKDYKMVVPIPESNTCVLTNYIANARSQCLKVDNDTCLSVEQFKNRMEMLGCYVEEEIHVKEFMSTKKSYEVQTMSPLIASLFKACSGTHCVDLGGGRGYLPVVLDLGYSVPSLAVDCDAVALDGGRKRDALIKKQWPSITRTVSGRKISNNSSSNVHHFVHSFVTRSTDLTALIENYFPNADGVKILLTGLHTCGDLGPDSLRIFTANPQTVAVFNVPCCYHLLTERVSKDTLWNEFDDTVLVNEECGFPMSQYLRGFQLGRNARMLAAQSIDRVVNMKQLPSRSLYYRAVLQDILKKYLPSSTVPEGKMKRITPKIQNITEYLNKADDILKLGLKDRFTENQLAELSISYECHWKNLILFYLLRLCLAQVVETVILLDRMLFLHENCYNGYLVKLFNPTLSPRCHALVAVR